MIGARVGAGSCLATWGALSETEEAMADSEAVDSAGVAADVRGGSATKGMEATGAAGSFGSQGGLGSSSAEAAAGEVSRLEGTQGGVSMGAVGALEAVEDVEVTGAEASEGLTTGGSGAISQD